MQNREWRKPKPVALYDFYGDYLQTFDSMNRLAIFLKGGTGGVISAIERKTRFRGHYVRYVEPGIDPAPTVPLSIRARSKVFEDKRPRSNFGMPSMAVACYDIVTGKLVAAYTSYSSAATATGQTPGKIARCCKVPYFTADQKQWRRIDSVETAPKSIEIAVSPQIQNAIAVGLAFEKEQKQKLSKRVIEQLDMDGNPTGREFRNQLAAADAVGITRQMLNFVFKRPDRYRSAGGFKWRFKANPEEQSKIDAVRSNIKERNVKLGRRKEGSGRLPLPIDVYRVVKTNNVRFGYYIETIHGAANAADRFKVTPAQVAQSIQIGGVVSRELDDNRYLFRRGVENPPQLIQFEKDLLLWRKVA